MISFDQIPFAFSDDPAFFQLAAQGTVGGEASRFLAPSGIDRLQDIFPEMQKVAETYRYPR